MSVKTLAGGRYRLERLLGRGGMASVFLASDTELERPVAIKLLAEHLADDDNFRRRFLREARMAAGLGHPNIVQVFDAGEEKGSPYIVMELVDGESIYEARLRRGKLPFAEVVDLAVSICAGLEHAHAAGLVHRDLKPQNLLLRHDGTVKIADFGIARTHGATKLTETGTLLGSAAYLAPEQAAGQEVTSAADIYSLGAVLYELLAGRTPHSFDSLVEFVAKQRSASITPLRELSAEVPEALAWVVMRCLALDPKDRPASAAELAGELRSATSLEAPPRPLAEASDRSATEVLTAPQKAETTARTVALGEAWQRAMRPRATEIMTAPLRAARTVKTIVLGEPREGRKWFDARRIALGVVSLVVLSAIAIGLVLNSEDTGEGPNSPEVRVSPVPRSSDPAQQARELTDWLRQHSRGQQTTSR